MNHILIRIPLQFWKFKWWKEINHKTPACWDELTGPQLVKVLKLIDSCDDVYRFRMEILKYFLRLKWYHFIIINSVVFIQLFKYFQWIEDNLDINKTHFPYIAGLYGPPNGIIGMTGIEFMIMDTHYLAWRKNSDQEALNSLIACLYRKKRADYSALKHGYDKREEFNPYGVEFLAKKIKKVPTYVKMGVLRYYECTRMKWEKNYDKVFTEAEKSAENYGWPETFMKMAETGVFGSIEYVEKAPIHNIFLKMQIDVKDYEAFKVKNNIK